MTAPQVAEETRVARGTLGQQAAQVVGALSMLVAITVVGRSLSLAEFGLYGLLISIASYLLLVQTSVEGSAVRAIASAPTREDRERLFTLALMLYVAIGAAAGALLAAVGVALVTLLPVSDELEGPARGAVLAIGVLTALGWPFKASQDLLRGSQRFLGASVGEILAYLAFLTITVALVAAGAPLWALIVAGASVPILIGVGCFAVLAATGTLPRLRRDGVSRTTARELLGFSAYLSVIGIADILIFAVDRIVLAAFTSASTVGLYEGAARPHHLVRQVHGTLSITVFPVASGYLADRDEFRLRELLVRGTRYVHGAVVPVAVTLIVLAGPILDVWLGERFREAGSAMAILISYWLVNAGTGVAGAMLIAAGEVRWSTTYAWAVAAGNLVLSIALTAWLGLEGVMLGTAIPFFLAAPFVVAKAGRVFAVPVAEMLRKALAPAWIVGAVVAAALTAGRAALAPDSLGEVAGLMVAGPLIAFAVYAVFVFGDEERRLVRGVFRRAATF